MLTVAFGARRVMTGSCELDVHINKYLRQGLPRMVAKAARFVVISWSIDNLNLDYTGTYGIFDSGVIDKVAVSRIYSWM